MAYTLTQLIKAVSDDIAEAVELKNANDERYDKPRHDLNVSILNALNSLDYAIIQGSSIVSAHVKGGGGKFKIPLSESLSILAGKVSILKQQRDAAIERCSVLNARLEKVLQKDLFRQD